MLFSFSLPAHQDCHEMQFKKKRKKEGKQQLDNSSGKPKLHQEVIKQESPVAEAQPKSHLPPTFNKSHVSKPLHAKPQLSVPLPSAPLSTANILESLTSSMIDTNSEPLHLKKVIAVAQHNLINQITKTLEQKGDTNNLMVDKYDDEELRRKTN